MEASQHEYSPGSIEVNPINTKLRTYDGNSGTLSPFGQYGMLKQNLELGKTESRQDQEKNRWRFTQSSWKPYFNYIS